MNKVLLKLKHKLIVSCQAEGNSPFNTPEGVALFALAAKIGGAAAIRLEGVEKTKKIIECVDLPVIALLKSTFGDGFVKITRTFKEVEALLELNIDIVAIDGTFRLVDGMSGPEFIQQCKERYKDICIMADISELSEAAACVKNGADCVSTTLRGYTPSTLNGSAITADIPFIKELCALIRKVPVIAEGKINNPEISREIAKLGVWSIVVGSAITRPQIITEWFANSFNDI